ncbi:unnamed protein product, partial [Porites evermanni]
MPHALSSWALKGIPTFHCSPPDLAPLCGNHAFYSAIFSIRYFPLRYHPLSRWKDRKGKTKKFHVPACSLFGTKQASLCACPTNLAAGTVNNLIGKLRSLFTDLGRGRKVTELLDVGNPASHASFR